ncbi:MAG: hypothetical protein AAGL89_02985 [Pseudomonadota bacterium]
MTYFAVTDADTSLPTPPLPVAAIASLRSTKDRTTLKWLIASVLTLLILGTDLLAAPITDTAAPTKAHHEISQEV